MICKKLKIKTAILQLFSLFPSHLLGIGYFSKLNRSTEVSQFFGIMNIRVC